MSQEKKELRHGTAETTIDAKWQAREQGIEGMILKRRRFPFGPAFKWVESPDLVADLESGMTHNEASDRTLERIADQPRSRLLRLLGVGGRTKGISTITDRYSFPDSGR